MQVVWAASSGVAASLNEAAGGDSSSSARGETAISTAGSGTLSKKACAKSTCSTQKKIIVIMEITSLSSDAVEGVLLRLRG